MSSFRKLVGALRRTLGRWSGAAGSAVLLLLLTAAHALAEPRRDIWQLLDLQERDRLIQEHVRKQYVNDPTYRQAAAFPRSERPFDVRTIRKDGPVALIGVHSIGLPGRELPADVVARTIRDHAESMDRELWNTPGLQPYHSVTLEIRLPPGTIVPGEGEPLGSLASELWKKHKIAVNVEELAPDEVFVSEESWRKNAEIEKWLDALEPRVAAGEHGEQEAGYRPAVDYSIGEIDDEAMEEAGFTREQMDRAEGLAQAETALEYTLLLLGNIAASPDSPEAESRLRELAREAYILAYEQLIEGTLESLPSSFAEQFKRVERVSGFLMPLLEARCEMPAGLVDRMWSRGLTEEDAQFLLDRLWLKPGTETLLEQLTLALGPEVYVAFKLALFTSSFVGVLGEQELNSLKDRLRIRGNPQIEQPTERWMPAGELMRRLEKQKAFVEWRNRADDAITAFNRGGVAKKTDGASIGYDVLFSRSDAVGLAGGVRIPLPVGQRAEGAGSGKPVVALVDEAMDRSTLVRFLEGFQEAAAYGEVILFVIDGRVGELLDRAAPDGRFSLPEVSGDRLRELLAALASVESRRPHVLAQGTGAVALAQVLGAKQLAGLERVVLFGSPLASDALRTLDGAADTVVVLVSPADVASLVSGPLSLEGSKIVVVRTDGVGHLGWLEHPGWIADFFDDGQLSPSTLAEIRKREEAAAQVEDAFSQSRLDSLSKLNPKGLPPPPPPGMEALPVEIKKAIAEGKIEAEVEGTGNRSSLKLRITNMTDGWLLVGVPSGSSFNPTTLNVQNMVIR